VAGGAKLLARRPPPSALGPSLRSSSPGDEPVDTTHPLVLYDPTCVLSEPENAYLRGKRQAYDTAWLFNSISCYSTGAHLVG
jgi:hypothetical protein